MTKEEILSEFMTDDRTRESIYVAMNEYARQCILGIRDWIDGNNADFEFGQCEYKDWDKLTGEQVVDRYIESLNSQTK